MTLAIMQPYLFPYIGYFQLINAVDRFVILDDVNFINRGWINRNRILVNGKENLFTVPLKKISQNRLICECELGENKWKDKFLKTLEFSYKKAPYFKNCYNLISSLIVIEETNLSRWLTFQIRAICYHIGINTTIIDTSRIYKNPHLKAQDKILDICIKEKADTYYNPVGGINLYNPDDFKRHNIKLSFLKSLPEKYLQNGIDFIPFLSIIDVMMFNDKEQIKELLIKYAVI